MQEEQTKRITQFAIKGVSTSDGQVKFIKKLPAGLQIRQGAN